MKREAWFCDRANRVFLGFLFLLGSVDSLSQGYGLSHSSCVLPHVSPHAPFVQDRDMLANGNCGDTATAMMQAPVVKLNGAKPAAVPVELQTNTQSSAANPAGRREVLSSWAGGAVAVAGAVFIAPEGAEAYG